MSSTHFLCPLCNGFTNETHIPCPNCSADLKNVGPVSDLLAPYSPYRELEDMKLTDGWMDQQTHTCPHQLYCPTCGYSDIHFYQEINL